MANPPLPGTLGQSVRPSDLDAYARDLWPRHHLRMQLGDAPSSRPRAIVWPETTAQVAKLVQWARDTQTPLVPFGAGSGVCGAILPSRDSVIVDLKRMVRWRSLAKEIPAIDVEAGALGLPFEDALNREGFTLGHFPSSILCSTVGGWLAARSAGQCSSRYGKIEDMCIDLECVLGTGETVRMLHRPAGPSLVPLMVGSEGTLGIITAAKLRLHPMPRERTFAAWAFRDAEKGWTAMRLLMQGGLRPAVCRLYDPFDAWLARRPRSERRSHSKGSPWVDEVRRRVARTILRRPTFVNHAFDGLGDLLGGAMLIAIFEGNDASGDLARARSLLEDQSQRFLGEGPARRWLSHRYAISYKQSPTYRSGLFLDTFEVAAPWAHIDRIYDAVRGALAEHGMVMAHWSHAYPDGCCIYFTFAGALEGDALARYDAAWQAGLSAATAAHGTLAHHHGIGRSKASHLEQELSSGGVAALASLKRALDPDGIMNPGALFPAKGIA